MVSFMTSDFLLSYRKTSTLDPQFQTTLKTHYGTQNTKNLSLIRKHSGHSKPKIWFGQKNLPKFWMQATNISTDGTQMVRWIFVTMPLTDMLKKVEVTKMPLLTIVLTQVFKKLIPINNCIKMSPSWQPSWKPNSKFRKGIELWSTCQWSHRPALLCSLALEL